MTSLDVQLLGPVTTKLDGQPIDIGGAKPRSVLAVLALSHGAVVSASALVSYLWDEPIPDRAEHTLQQHISALRKALVAPGEPSRGGSPLVTRPPGYLLELTALDVDELDRHERLAREQLSQRDVQHGLESIEAALALVRGPALANVRGTARIEATALRLDERILTLGEDRAETLLALGRHREVAVEIEVLVEQEPFRERLRFLQMLALYRSGRQTDALAAFRSTRTALIEELGVEPGPELRELEQRILEQDPALDLAPAAVPRTVHSTIRAEQQVAFGWIELPDGQAIALQASTRIGRAEDAQVHLVDSRVSREHALIERNGDDMVLTDLGSTNGTAVNGRRVSKWSLEDGDVVSVGGTQLVYRDVSAEAVPGSSVESPN